MHDPRAELSRRLAARRDAVARLDGRDAATSRGRLAAFVAALALAWLSLGAHRISAAWLAVPLAAFVALAALHDRVFRARARLRRAIAFHERALARLDGRFAGTGTPGDEWADPAHPCALDLDLFGKGSLFELLCAARTRPGEARLASWLLAPAPPDEVRARQRAVAALAPRLDLREDLAVLGDDVRAAVDPAALAAWGEAPGLVEPWLLQASLALAAAAVGAAVAWALGLGPVPLVAILVAEWGFVRSLREPVARVLAGLERPAAELRVVAELLARLEAEPVDDPRLVALPVGPHRRRASAPPRAIARLESTVSRMEWARNQFFAPIAFALCWTPLHAALVERWRLARGAVDPRLARCRRRPRGALLPRRPRLRAPGGSVPGDPWTSGRIGAPSWTGRRCATRSSPAPCRTTSRLGGDGPRVLLVSGSNMSGKSTYLRTVGVNVVLALAGAPVRAARLRLTPLRPGATCGSRTRSRPAARGSTRRSRGSRSSPTSPRARSRSCSSSTRSSTARTRTTGGSARRRSCGAWWREAPSAS